MKIAFVYDMVYPFKIGGVEKRIWEISRRLAGMGNEVHIFGLKIWDGPSDILREGVHIHGVSRKFPFHTGDSGRRAIFPALWFSLALFLPLLRKGRFDVVDCQNFPYFHCFTAKMASLIRRSPFMITWHEVWGTYWRDYLGRKGAFGIVIERLVMNLTEYHVAVSRTTKAQLHRLGVMGSIAIIPNGVDMERIRGISPSSERSDVIFVGRLIRDKHVDILVGALSLLHDTFPDIRCSIVGRGPEEERLKAQVSSAGLEKNVRFIGFAKGQDEILSLMKSSGICVLPSTREGFGMVALEALACGIPVVTADHPGNAIRDLAVIGGVYVVPLTREDFAGAIRKRLLSSSTEETAAQLDGASDWDAVTRQWLEIIKTFTCLAEKIPAKGSL